MVLFPYKMGWLQRGYQNHWQRPCHLNVGLLWRRPTQRSHSSRWRQPDQQVWRQSSFSNQEIGCQRREHHGGKGFTSWDATRSQRGHPFIWCSHQGTSNSMQILAELLSMWRRSQPHRPDPLWCAYQGYCRPWHPIIHTWWLQPRYVILRTPSDWLKQRNPQNPTLLNSHSIYTHWRLSEAWISFKKKQGQDKDIVIPVKVKMNNNNNIIILVRAMQVVTYRYVK